MAKADGGLDMTDYQRATLRQFCKDNQGRRVRLEIDIQTPESRKQRAFYHGAMLPLIAYFQDGMDYRSTEDVATIHEWLKIEFNGDFVEIKGKALKIAKSTRGELPAFIERVLEWMGEQGYPVELLNPEGYKKWDISIFPFGGPDTYIGYLLESGKLNTPESYT